MAETIKDINKINLDLEPEESIAPFISHEYTDVKQEFPYPEVNGGPPQQKSLLSATQPSFPLDREVPKRGRGRPRKYVERDINVPEGITENISRPEQVLAVTGDFPKNEIHGILKSLSSASTIIIPQAAMTDQEAMMISAPLSRYLVRKYGIDGLLDKFQKLELLAAGIALIGYIARVVKQYKEDKNAKERFGGSQQVVSQRSERPGAENVDGSGGLPAGGGGTGDSIDDASDLAGSWGPGAPGGFGGIG